MRPGGPARRPTAWGAATGANDAVLAQDIFGMQIMHPTRPTCNQLVVAAEIAAGRW